MNDKTHIVRETYNEYGLSSRKVYKYNPLEMIIDLKTLVERFCKLYEAMSNLEKYRNDPKLLNEVLFIGKESTRISKGKELKENE